ncbi:MAG: protein kinase domain-containing protein, partial [Gemmataceae bacterium]
MIAEHFSPDDLQNYRVGNRSPADSTLIENHLETCADCRAELERLPDDGFTGRVQEALRASPAAAMSLGSIPDVSFTIRPSSMAAATPILPGELPAEFSQLPQYSNIRPLGQGGMGVVYRATNARMGRDEVLKVVNRALLQRAGALERFEREIRAAGQLQHPNIVTAYAAHEIGEMLILSMEFVNGPSLDQYLKEQGPLGVARATQIVLQAARGLGFAHQANLVHRDIKPGNLMLAQSAGKTTVKVLDFGLAKAVDGPEQANLTGDGKMLGTPSTMAPEQIRNSAKADHRADIYSLGCTLFCLLTGRPPFVEDSIIGVLMAHTTQPPPRLTEFRADVPAALDELIQKCLAKDPAARPQSMTELMNLLKPFTSASRALATSTVSITEPTPLPVMKQARRPKWFMPVLLGGLLALLGLGLFAGGVFRVKTPEGILELTDLPADAEVLVDGAKVQLSWAAGKQTAEVRVVPGSRKLEVISGGVTVRGEEVTLSSGERKTLSAKLVPVAAAAPTNLVPKNPDMDLSEDEGPRRNGHPTTTHAGNWTNSANTLYLDGEAQPYFPQVSFGNSAWTNYDFRIQFKRIDPKAHQIGLCVRSDGPENQYTFSLGAFGNTLDQFEQNQGGKWKQIQTRKHRLAENVWYTATVKMRFNTFECLLATEDGPDIRVFVGQVNAFDRGRVGLLMFKTGGYLIRNVEVTDPAGKELWNGLPEVRLRPRYSDYVKKHLPNQEKIDRLANINGGQWAIKDGVLRQTSNTTLASSCVFGGVWTEYDFAAELRSTGGSSAQLVYHSLGLNRRTMAFLRGKLNERSESMLVVESTDLNGWLKHEVFNKPFKPAVNNRD